MKKIFITCITILFSNVVFADCASTDQECINRLLIETSNDNADAALNAILLVGVVYGVYSLASYDDEPEDANLRAKEMADGLGIRLNSFNAPYRVSFLEPANLNIPEANSTANEPFKDTLQFKVFSFEYNWQ